MRHSNEKSYVLSKGYDEIRFSDEINMFIYFCSIFHTDWRERNKQIITFVVCKTLKDKRCYYATSKILI